MKPGSTHPVINALAGFLIGWGSVIIPMLTIAFEVNDDRSQLHYSILDGSGVKLRSSCELEALPTGS